ncbi:hypothetical protein ACP70R_011382 [Stipagrostis hirtigluma subsp. patula]
MATSSASLVLVAFVLVVAVSASVDDLKSPQKYFLIDNMCNYKVWPANLAGAGSPGLDFKGVALEPRRLNRILLPVPHGWSGRIWGRTLCPSDATGKFTCVTGDCGTGRLDCAGGSGPTPPATVAEFTMDGKGGKDSYDVSLVDGFNLPMRVLPHGGCPVSGCAADLNAACPADQQVTSAGGVVACKASAGSRFFKKACPGAKSSGADNALGCAGEDDGYTITFCPPS